MGGNGGKWGICGEPKEKWSKLEDTKRVLCRCESILARTAQHLLYGHNRRHVETIP